MEAKVKIERELIDSREQFDASIFYSQHQSSVEAIERRAGAAVRSCRKTLTQLLKALNDRKENTLSAQKALALVDPSDDLSACYTDYEKARIAANAISSTLKKDQEDAKAVLRLAEVREFVETIDHDKQTNKIEKLNREVELARKAQAEIKKTIDEKELAAAEKQRQLNDEEQGAIRVNELLNGFFGNRYLSLQAIEKDGDGVEKRVRFEVVRNAQKAYHLSEGERSLLAFCYFMAKLEEVDTANAKPVVWIDDPISSLDGNHIFCLYSLINACLTGNSSCKQLFISTHSLEFLKYLRRIHGVAGDESSRQYFIVQRTDDVSSLKPMPKHLKNYFTEFNYLFEQIYECAAIAHVDDSNFSTFYGFGNNARKFLEIYLYYLYPDDRKDAVKMELFFGTPGVPDIISRVNHEYSHLAGVFERGALPIEQPEMHSCARLIIERLKQNQGQFASLLRSIGKTAEAENFETICANSTTVAKVSQ